MIQQAGYINNKHFKKGDLCKVIVETDGTKNVYIGRFLFFKTKFRFKEIFSNHIHSISKKLIFRHHTFCAEGFMSIYEDEITDITVIKEGKK